MDADERKRQRSRAKRCFLRRELRTIRQPLARREDTGEKPSENIPPENISISEPSPSERVKSRWKKRRGKRTGSEDGVTREVGNQAGLVNGN